MAETFPTGHRGEREQWSNSEELRAFSAVVERFANRQLSADEFRDIRLRQGIYSQRQPERYMVRVKIPGGRLDALQMETLGQLAREFADGQGHVTTRQDIQVHHVQLGDIPPMLRRMAAVGLTTREACGNCVRNVTACPLAGLCSREEFDVTPHATAVARALLRNPQTQRLPRKFKIAFSGCAEDCSLAAINDIGLLARSQHRDGQTLHGFQLLAGGGLGNWPRAAQALAEFVPLEQLSVWVEAVLDVFNKFGNRQDRNRARLKFLLAEKGSSWFREQVIERVQKHGVAVPAQASLAPVGAQGSASASTLFSQRGAAGVGSGDVLRWLQSNVWPQRQDGLAAVWVTLPQGAIDSEQFAVLANLARRYGDASLRTTPTQNVILPNVTQASLRDVYAQLGRFRLALPGALEISDITACPGAETCNLGLTHSRSLAAVLSVQLRTEEDAGVRGVAIKISGCPNSCGQHHVADIGLHGMARKVEGQAAPFYQLLLGGGVRRGARRFGQRVATVPARRVPEAVARLLAFYRTERQADESFESFVGRIPLESFRALLLDITRVDFADSEMHRDWGQEETFQVRVGKGECAS